MVCGGVLMKKTESSTFTAPLLPQSPTRKSMKYSASVCQDKESEKKKDIGPKVCVEKGDLLAPG